jgi:hypothetical protein
LRRLLIKTFFKTFLFAQEKSQKERWFFKKRFCRNSIYDDMTFKILVDDGGSSACPHVPPPGSRCDDEV